MLSLGLLLIAILALSCLSSTIFKERNNEALAQQYIQTIKYRNLVLDLGNGLKTNAQLTLPAIGKGPFPGVLLIPGSGAADKNESLGYVLKNKPQPVQPLLQIAQYLSERGFAVLRYDKRGIGANFTILDKNVWRNMTFNDLKQDAEKALNVLIGHSEGAIIAPRVAVDNPTKVKNIILIGAEAQNLRDNVYFQYVYLPILYAEKVLDHKHNGLISLQEASKDPTFEIISGKVISHLLQKQITNNSNATSNRIIQQQQSRGNSTNNNAEISIDKGLKPLLLKRIESLTAYDPKCVDLEGCPTYVKSHFALDSTLNMIGNASSTTGILILQGENDTNTPVQQAFMLQQRLTELNHPDHTLITYPGLAINCHPQLVTLYLDLVCMGSRKLDLSKNMLWQIFMHGLKLTRIHTALSHPTHSQRNFGHKYDFQQQMIIFLDTHLFFSPIDHEKSISCLILVTKLQGSYFIHYFASLNSLSIDKYASSPVSDRLHHPCKLSFRSWTQLRMTRFAPKFGSRMSIRIS